MDIKGLDLFPELKILLDLIKKNLPHFAGG